MPSINFDDLGAFFSTELFGESATLHTGSGDHPIVGIPSSSFDDARPGVAQNSTRSPFSTGVADFTVQNMQFSTTYNEVLQAGAKSEDSLTIVSGEYAGNYRIWDIRRNGAVCRLMLNLL